MGNGWHEWPLVIFTVLGQCVVGALIVSGIGWFAAKNDADRQHIIRGMFFLWLLMGIGFIASVMHLGSPLRAFNSLNRIGASGLSNEIAAGSIFFLVTCQHGTRHHFRLDDDLRVSNRHCANLA